MTVSTSSGADEVDPRRRGRLHVTLLGHPLLPAAVAAIAGPDRRDRRQHRPHRAALARTR